MGEEIQYITALTPIPLILLINDFLSNKCPLKAIDILKNQKTYKSYLSHSFCILTRHIHASFISFFLTLTVKTFP